MRRLGPMLAAAIWCVTGRAAATVFDPKVTTDTSVDCTSRETILRDIIQPGMTDEQKAIAVWRFVRSRIYHYAHTDRQPLRQLNVYGYALCGTQAAVMQWLMKGVFGDKFTHGAGIYGNADSYEERKRQSLGWLIDTWERGAKNNPGGGKMGHSMYEVYYAGRWHFLDPHAGFYVYTGDGSIADLDEIKSDPTLVSWPFRKSDPFFPCDGGDGLFYYQASGGGSGWGGPMEVKTSMAFNLRRGDAFTRLFDKIPGKYVNAGQAYGGWTMDYLRDGPRHVCNNGEYLAWQHWGNGVLEYRPDLKAGHLADALTASENVAYGSPGRPAVSPADPAKPMSFTIRTALPYVLIDFSIEAEVVSAPGAPATIALTAGRTSRTLWTAPKGGKQAVALKDVRIEGNYEYDLTFAFPPRRDDEPVGLEALTVTTVCQLNYFALPRLVPGRNTVRVTAADTPAPDGALKVTWTWTEAAGQRADTRLITAFPAEYTVEVGAVATTPAENPKYMQSLRMEVIEGKSGDSMPGWSSPGDDKRPMLSPDFPVSGPVKPMKPLPLVALPLAPQEAIEVKRTLKPPTVALANGRLLCDLKDVQFGTPRWSPDDRWLAFEVTRFGPVEAPEDPKAKPPPPPRSYDVYICRPDGTGLKRIYQAVAEKQAIDDLAWVGRHVVFALTTPQGRQLRVLDLDGKSIYTGPYDPFTVTRTQAFLVLRADGVHRFDPASGETKRISAAPPKDQRFTDLAAPDDLAYLAARVADDTHLLFPDGTQVVVKGLVYAEPAPDGRHLAGHVPVISPTKIAVTEGAVLYRVDIEKRAVEKVRDLLPAADYLGGWDTMRPWWLGATHVEFVAAPKASEGKPYRHWRLYRADVTSGERKAVQDLEAFSLKTERAADNRWSILWRKFDNRGEWIVLRGGASYRKTDRYLMRSANDVSHDGTRLAGRMQDDGKLWVFDLKPTAAAAAP